MNASPRYPKPSDIGGTLIRRVVAQFKEKRRSLPLKGGIAISVSGGVDSMVLAHLLCRYGRRIIPDPKTQVTLLHFDHQWRPESAGPEKLAVAELAASLEVGFQSIRLEAPGVERRSNNWEDDARQKRQEQYRKLRGGKGGYRWIFTAHHHDDLIETLVWRFFRGELLTHREGILFQHDGCLRPFLKVFKEEIYRYAEDERVPYFEDPSNRDTVQIRAHFRTELFPLLETRFPGFKSAMLRYVKTGRHAGRKSR